VLLDIQLKKTKNEKGAPMFNFPSPLFYFFSCQKAEHQEQWININTFPVYGRQKFLSTHSTSYLQEIDP
jgi:hypothetical protein